MKTTTTNIIIFIIVAIAAVLLALKRVDTKNKDKVFSIENIDDINKVFMVDKANNTVLLERKGSSWILNDNYYALDQMVTSMLNIVRRLQVREPVPRSAYDNIVSILATSATKVEFYGKGYYVNFLGIKLFPKNGVLLKSFFVGDSTSDKMGAYMINEHSSKPYVVYIPGYRGYVAPYFSAEANVWKAHFVFHERMSQIDTVKYIDNENPEESYILINPDSKNFILKRYKDGSVVRDYDTTKVADLLSSFSDVRYEYLIEDTTAQALLTKDSILRTVPTNILTLIDKNGLETTISTYRIKYVDYWEIGETEIDKDRLYGLIHKPNRIKSKGSEIIYDEDFAVLQYFSFDPILRPLNLLMKD